jgi:hypothetical protein
MEKQNKVSRRGFFRTTALAAPAIIGAGSLAGCRNKDDAADRNTESFPLFRGAGYHPSDGPSGLLFSQIGYEPGLPLRIILRLPKKELIKKSAECRLIPTGNENNYKAPVTYWGEIWGSHWWVVSFDAIEEEGEWSIELWQDGECLIVDKGLQVEKNILWNKTVELAAADMLERRVHFTKVGAGWQDAGTLWVESCAQSAMVIGLEDLLEIGNRKLTDELLGRIHKQIIVGCRYFVMLEKKARELGFPAGAQSHDLHGHEKDILPADTLKSVIALSRAVKLLPEEFSAEKETFRRTALSGWDWLLTNAKPLGSYGMSLFQRGIPEDSLIPAGEWQTRDLLLFCLAAIRMADLTGDSSLEKAIEFAGKIVRRQIPQEKNENGYFGHFYEFDSLQHSEKSWTHGIVNNQFGADLGGIYPNHLLPLIELITRLPDHAEAPSWKITLENFVNGYLIPACSKNPFLLVPQGIFGKEGPVWFCGTFHGTNTIYGHTAALALELEKIMKEPRLKEIAYGNLLWLAGLNAGITKDNLQAAVIFSTDVPDGMALPASMMCGVGNRSAGTWFQTRGVICNGFSTGKQFVYDTEPKMANDGPFSFTDEDWIPHSAAWLSGLVRLS